MSQRVEGATRTFLAGEAIAAFRRVKVLTTSETVVYADAGDDSIGITEAAAAIGAPVAVRLNNAEGTRKMTCSAAVALFAKVYGTDDGKVDDSSGGAVAGIAFAAATANGDIIEVYPLNDTQVVSRHTLSMWVDGDRQDDYTADGTESRPYKTMEAAWAALTATRNTIFVRPGTYTLAANLALPAFDVRVIGIGPNDAVTITGGTTALFERAAGALTATTTYSWENIFLDHGDTIKGILIDNTLAEKKIILAGRNVEFGGSANAIDVATHGDAGNAVRIHWNNGGMEIEGPVNFAVGNDGDQVRFSDTILSGGLVSNTAATVMEFTLRNCEILVHGITGGAVEQVMNLISCHERNGAAMIAADTGTIAGTFTENILAV